MILATGLIQSPDLYNLLRFSLALLTMRQDTSFLYRKPQAEDGYLITVRGDFAEMTKVNCSKHTSRYVRLEAPTKIIRQAVSKLTKQGYKLCVSLDLQWRDLAA